MYDRSVNKRYFALALKQCTKGDTQRDALIGAVGIRHDGVIVFSHNGKAMQKCGQVHAEVRLSKKLGVGSDVYVARSLRDGTPAIAKPCPNCQNVLRHRGVKRVYYTIARKEYGVLDLS